MAYYGQQQTGRQSLLRSGYVSPVASALTGATPLAPTGYAAPDSRVGNVQFGGQYATPPRTPAPAQPAAPAPPPLNTAPVPGAYSLNTDPVLQQITALTGMGDEQANSAALKQRQQLLLGYGDQNLASQVLGAGDPTVQAAAQNPASIVAQLATQRDRNLHNLTEGLNQANLFYSGDRIVQEQQAAQDYQAQLAAAAGQAGGGLDTIAGNLSAALGQNQQQRTQAASDAYNRALELALQTGYGAAAGPGAAAGATQATPVDPVTGQVTNASAGWTPAGATPSPLAPSQLAVDPNTGYGLTGPGAVNAYGVIDPATGLPIPGTAGGATSSAPAAPTGTIDSLVALLTRAIQGRARLA